MTRMCLPGIAQMAAGAVNPEYFHGDQIGTTRAMTDSSYTAQVVRQASYTAFGELVASSGSTDARYGYVGAHGYEETLLPGWDLLHVGARWHDPATDRFLQRDPIGIRGKLNVYEYVRGIPTILIDPDGLVYRDATGRFARAPWWRRGLKWGSKRFPIYMCASFVARVGHRIAGKPYEDPVMVIGDIVGNLGRAAWLEAQRLNKQHKLRPKVEVSPRARYPVEVPCGPHY